MGLFARKTILRAVDIFRDTCDHKVKEFIEKVTIKKIAVAICWKM